MEKTAQSQKVNSLITEVNSILGASIANLLLKKNNNVYGISKKPPSAEVLENPNFTLLDIDISQPLPTHVPSFDLIVHLLSESTQTLKNFRVSSSLTPATNNIIDKAKNQTCKVILMAPLITSDFFYEHIAKKQNTQENLRLFLIGDIYGPRQLVGKNQAYIHDSLNKPHHFYERNELTDLIYQAIVSDKIILADEGLKTVVPTYIDDALSAFSSFDGDYNKKSVSIIVSEGPRTALNVAYEIQKIAQFTLNKQLKLFFSGPAKVYTPEPQPVIRLEYLGFEPKINLAEGLKKVFESYRINISSEEFTFKPQQETKHLHQLSPAIQLPISKEQKVESKKTQEISAPKYLLNLSLQKVFLGILFILVLTIIKTGLDIYWGISELKSAKKALSTGQLEIALNNSKSAEKSFRIARNKFKLLTLPLAPVLPAKRDSITYALESGRFGAISLQFFIEGAYDFVQNLKVITASQDQKSSLDIEKASANFKQAYLTSTQAYELARISANGYTFLQKLSLAQQNFKELSDISSTSLGFVNFIKDLTGSSDKKTYLVLLQNNNELRPGGGFIDSYGEIIFENGHLMSLNFKDIYTIDSQLKEKIDAPKELTDKLGLTQLYLRDSNWSTDFIVNGKTARDFYKKETGLEVDGVIAMDLTFIQKLLFLIGPIIVKNSTQEISSDNLFNHNQSYDQIAQALFNKLAQSFSQIDANNIQNINLNELFKTTQMAISQKHLLLIFDNQNLSSLVKTKGWDNALPPILFDPSEESSGSRDFVALSETNLGANKANRDIERKIDYSMTVGRDADLKANLKITYTNKAQANTWPAGTYVNFLRVYAPKDAGLSDFQNGELSDLDAVEVSNPANLAVFSTFVEVPVGKTHEVTFTYKIPKNIKLEQAPTYHLYISKQPGTDKDSLTFSFNLPDNIEAKSVNGDQTFAAQKNIKIETDLSTDRQFEINLKKK